MADPRPQTQPRTKNTGFVRSQPPAKRETADERRLRRLAVAQTVQADLKREAAERRERKSAS
jgi:hypothetical protein